MLVNWPLLDAKNVEQFCFHLQEGTACAIFNVHVPIEKKRRVVRIYNIVEKKSFDYNCCNTTPKASCDEGKP